MPHDLTPLPSDFERNLAADLAWVNTYGMATERDRLRWSAAIRRALHAEAEVRRLRGIVESLAARCAAQSELLTRRAEGP